jgi:two-component system sensor kinase
VETKYRFLFDHAPIAISVTDLEGRFVEYNPLLREMFGFSAEEMSRLHSVNLYSDPGEWTQLIERLRATNSVHDLDVKLRRKDGSMFNALLNVDIVDWGGRKLLFATAWDISEQVRMEEELLKNRDHLENTIEERTRELNEANARLQKEMTEREQADERIQNLNKVMQKKVSALVAANKDLDAFSHSVSHDLRAPMRAIDSFSRVLLEEYNRKLDDEGKRVIGIIRNNIARLNRMVEDLLKLSRVGSAELEMRRVDMNSLAAKAIDEIKGTVQGRNLEFKLGWLPDAHGSPTMIQQVMVNLLSNAVKFTRPKEKAIIEVKGDVKVSEHIYSVSDNGIGFDMQNAGKLFGVFQRLHSQDEFEGNGIGLAIVSKIMSRHGGRVWAEAKPNEGATFFFALPIESEVKDELM